MKLSEQEIELLKEVTFPAIDKLVSYARFLIVGMVNDCEENDDVAIPAIKTLITIFVGALVNDIFEGDVEPGMKFLKEMTERLEKEALSRSKIKVEV